MRKASRSAFASGDVIDGRYVLRDQLGIGGTGVVFAALQPALGRTVALKMLRPELRLDATAVRRFRDEAIACSRLSHPNIVSVFDFGEADGAPFLAMQRLFGTPLGQLVMASGTMSLARASSIVAQILAALVEAHRLGMVHGDVKSDNVVVAPDDDGTDHATVIDFGLVRLVGQPSSNEADISGTPEYMAPEVVLGRVPTARSDIYAVGCVLYELVTGTTPFRGGSAHDIMSRHVEQPIAVPSTRSPELAIARDFEEVILTALAKNPEDRFPTAADFAVALRAVTPWSEQDHRSPQPSEVPLVFSSTTATLDWPPRCNIIGDAIASGDVDRIVVAYLDLAHELVGKHRMDEALRELAEAVDIITAGEGICARGPAPLWRLLVSMGAIQAGLGDLARARRYALHARSQATYARSPLGRARAQRLLSYLDRSRISWPMTCSA